MSTTSKPYKIFFFRIDPGSKEKTALQYKELSKIKDAIEGSLFEVKESDKHSPSDILHELNQFNPDIIHFSGHGTKDYLAFENYANTVKEKAKKTCFNLDELTEFLGGVLWSEKPRILFFNACLAGRIAENLFEKHAEDNLHCFIGMTKVLNQDLAIKFAQTFYTSLVKGDTIQHIVNYEFFGLIQALKIDHEDEDGYDPQPRLYGNIYYRFRELFISHKKIKERDLKEKSPYKGLKSFNSKDKDSFFGREQFIMKLVDALDKVDFILLLGASGSGKSSIISAGLIPQVERKKNFYSFVFTPGDNPFRSFYKSLRDKLPDTRFPQLENGAKRENANALKEIVKQKSEDEFWLIFIDQFEELFTITEEDKCRYFIEGIVKLVKTTDEPRSSVKLVATMRADFLARLSPYPKLVELAECPLITEMQVDELRLAIEQPAARHGVVFETGLVEEIIKDVQGQAGYLPLLQYTLNQLWESEVDDGGIHDRTLNIKSYWQLGGVRGALQERVSQIYGELSKPEQTAAQRIFLKLVGVDGNITTDWRPVRKRELRSRFTDPLEKAVLTQLINANLLVSDAPAADSDAEATVEIAHEILLTAWDKLKEWVEQNRENIALWNRLAEDAKHWKQEKLEDELWKGTKLAQAVDLQENSTFNKVFGNLGKDVTQFIEASVHSRDRQAREKEAQRQQELDQKKIQLAQETKARKMSQRVTIVASISGAVMAGLALLASFQVRQIGIQQIETYIALSDAHLLGNRGLEADIESIRAAKLLSNPLWQVIMPDQLKTSVLAQLQQVAVIGHERNQFRGYQSGIDEVAFSRDGTRLITFGLDSTISIWDNAGKQMTRFQSHQGEFYDFILSPDGTRLATREPDGSYRFWNTTNGTEITIFIGNQEEINNVVFSPGSTRIVIYRTDGTVHLLDANGNELSLLDGTQGQIKGVMFSLDDTQIVTRGADNTMRLWDARGTELAILKSPQGEIKDVAFSPSSTQLATHGEDGTVRLWNTNGTEVAVLEGHQEAIEEVLFSPTDTQLATHGEDGTVRLWNTNGTEVTVLEGHQGAIEEVLFSPTGTRLATHGEDGTVRLWNTNGTEVAVLEGHQGAIEEVLFSPTDTQLATHGEDGTVRLWNTNGTEVAVLEGHQGAIEEVLFSPTSTRLATHGEDGTVRLWNTSGTEVAALEGHQGAIYDIAFNPDGTRLATGGEDDTVRLWDINEIGLPTLKGHQGNSDTRIIRSTFSPEGNRLATLGDDGTVSLWDTNGIELHTIEYPQGELFEIEFSPDGKRLAVGGENGIMRLLDINGTELATLGGSQGRIYEVAFSPDGTQVVTIEVDEASLGISNIVRLWHINGTELATFEAPEGRVRDVVFDAESIKLALYGSITGEDLIAQVWDSSDAKLITLEGHRGSVSSIKFSPDGTQLVTTGVDNTARLWNTEGTELAVLEGHQGEIYRVAFSPDGTRLATAGIDMTVRLWGTSGNELDILNGHRGAVLDVEFSPNLSGRLATSGNDGTVRLWNTNGTELARLENLQAVSYNIVFSPDGTRLAINKEDGTVNLWAADSMDNLLSKQCDWVRDYLENSNEVEERDRRLCDGIGNETDNDGTSTEAPDSSTPSPTTTPAVPTTPVGLLFNHAANHAIQASELTQTAQTTD
ncbi:WD40 repeat domain-containing protein [Vacuolonema iberomarrocanum]|uniref:WD40 repeat domain-containing protein n=1 Tax=Vacuolonema iberomarrocanum TaxID=3454632 RepID=UPI0019F68AEC|nr:hypothetical protein [filamentous cyanobacterium LEGE 07170]